MSTCALVTGANGFVGGHLVEHLVHQGLQVRALVHSSSNSRLREADGVETIRGDIRNSRVVEKAAQGCEQVYHLAGKTSRTADSPQECYAVNVDGAKNVARAARKAGSRRVVYGSSVGVYGLLTDPPANEQTRPRPNTHYRRSKWMGEEVFRTHHDRNGLPAVIARLPSLLGPGTRDWLTWFSDLAANRSLMVGQGKNRKHPGDVADIVDGLYRCGQADGVDGECYLLAGPAPISFGEFLMVATGELGTTLPARRWPAFPFRTYSRVADVVFRLTNVELPYAHTCEFFLSEQVFSTEKAQQQLGYSPQISVEEGIRRTVQWYREQECIGQ